MNTARLRAALAAAALLLPAAGWAATVTHFPEGDGVKTGGLKVGPVRLGGKTVEQGPPFSEAVRAGNTLYISGTVDLDPVTRKPAADATAGARMVLNNIKKTVETAGYSMDDLVWVQIFASNIADYGAFNDVYRTYFKGPFPARAFIGAGSLLGGAHFEVMGIAVRSK